jgi:hypothetical protein
MTDEPEAPPVEQTEPQAPEAPPPIRLIVEWKGEGSAEFWVQRDPRLHPMMLAPFKDWLIKILDLEYTEVIFKARQKQQAEKQAAEEAAKKLEKRPWNPLAKPRWRHNKP